jgi:hypothetical protein
MFFLDNDDTFLAISIRMDALFAMFLTVGMSPSVRALRNDTQLGNYELRSHYIEHYITSVFEGKY